MGLQVYEESGAFVAGAVKALTALATSERNTEEVNQQGGVTQVVRALEAKPEYAEVAVNVCDMIGVCADQGASNSCRACADFMISLLISSFSLLSLPPPSGYNAGYFAAVNGIEAVLAALALAPSNCELAAAAAKGLNRMGLSHPQNLQRTVTAGSIPACVGSLTNLLDDVNVVQANLTFLATIATDPANVIPIVDAGGVQALILSLYRNPESDVIQEAGKRVVAMIVSPDAVIDEVKELQEALVELKASKDEATAERVEMACIGLVAFASCNVDIIVEEGGITALIDTLKWVSQQRRVPKQQEIMDSCFRALEQLSKDPKYVHVSCP